MKRVYEVIAAAVAMITAVLIMEAAAAGEERYLDCRQDTPDACIECNGTKERGLGQPVKHEAPRGVMR